MPNEIKLKRKTDADGIPLTTNLVAGELALNSFSGRLFFKKTNPSDSIVEVTTDITVGSSTFTLDSDANLFAGTGAGANLVAASALNNFLAGTNAGAAITTGDNNIAIGNLALNDATATLTGADNIAIGRSAMASSAMTTASDNIAIGLLSGKALSTGVRNVLVGSRSGTAIVSSQNITAIGYEALLDIRGNNNTALGTYAGTRIGTGVGNIAIGFSAIGTSAGSSGTLTGIDNIGIGETAVGGAALPTAVSRNIGIGRSAASRLFTGLDNVAIGHAAMSLSESGNENTIIGSNAGAALNLANSGNVYIGNGAGPAGTYSPLNSNLLFIHNAQSNTPLIGGDFAAGTVTINGNLTVTGNFGSEVNEFIAAGTGAQTVFNATDFAPTNLSYTTGINALDIYIDGVHQDSADFTETDFDTITFGTAPPNLATIVVMEKSSIAVNTVANTTEFKGTADGVKTVFTVADFTPAGFSYLSDIEVYLDGIRRPESEYTETNSTTITFTVAPANGVTVTVYARNNVAVSNAVNTSATAQTKSGALTLGGNLKLGKGADIVSAAALTPGTDGNYFDVTGVVAITSITTLGIGTVIKLHFDAALVLTHHATNLVLIDGVNITTYTGYEAEFIEYATGQWRMLSSNRELGSVVQILNVSTGGVSTGTTVIPTDDTIPTQSGPVEGDQYMIKTITPTNTNNILKIDVVINLSNNSIGQWLTAALFQDSVAPAIALGVTFMNTGGAVENIKFSHWMTAGTTASTTFHVRAGANVAGTTTLNGASGVRRYGGVLESSITITEYKA